eukprot:UN02802
MAKSKGAAKKNHQRRALQLLKQRKMYEKQLDNTMAQQFNIDQAKFTQESMQENANMVSAMKEATKTMKIQTQEINIDDVEDIYDDMEEIMFDQET